MFEKYYDHYARLAPLVDRVFGHFYDPGLLTDQEDVFQYMRLLEGKFKASNPAIRMGIDFWAAGPDYLQQLIDHGFQDYLLLENGMPLVNPPGVMEKRHRQAQALGLELGVWGWYVTEYETDQMASMYVNGHVLRDVYHRIRRDGHQIHPIAYWSEMEAHHLNNIYSMYVASQLLWNPDRDSHDILRERRRVSGDPPMAPPAQGPAAHRGGAQRANLGDLLVDHAAISHWYRPAGRRSTGPEPERR